MVHLMRISVQSDEDVYTAALALAQGERISVAEAINRLVRRGAEGRSSVANDARQNEDGFEIPHIGRKTFDHVTRCQTDRSNRRRTSIRTRMTGLLDGNLLVALRIDTHVCHEAAQRLCFLG